VSTPTPTHTRKRGPVTQGHHVSVPPTSNHRATLGPDMASAPPPHQRGRRGERSLERR